MTRESKLALIVGFGLILFVGILVSDHFSEGQRQEAAHLLAQRGALRGRSNPISLEPLVPGLSSSEVKQVRGEEPRSAPGGIAIELPKPPEPQAPNLNGEVVIGPGSHRPDGPNSPTQPPKPADNPQFAQDPNEGVKLHPVKEGETLFAISVRHYGDGTLWKALAEFNKSAVPNPARMRNGVTLRIPPIEVLKPGAMPRSAPAGAPAPTVPSSSPTAPAPGTYTVQRGETLSEIAQRTLGSSKRWPELVKANENVIRDPNALVPGTVIRIPVAG